MHRRPIVFLGPSMALDAARVILDAEYRPPIRRGDLDGLPEGSLVGIIDGVFQQDLAVSPREIQIAASRGMRILGSSSMGALRASEAPAMIGIGRVYGMYRDRMIDRDDEVALLFDAETHRAVTVPMVNVRFAVSRLVQAGTLTHRIGERILQAALALHYTERRYRTVLRRAGLNENVDEVVSLLERYDLKREDAQTLLEHLVDEQASLPAVLTSRSAKTTSRTTSSLCVGRGGGRPRKRSM